MSLSLSALPQDLIGEVLSNLEPLDVLAVAGASRRLRQINRNSHLYGIECYDASTTTLWLRASFEIPWRFRRQIDDATLVGLVSLFRWGVTRLVIHGLPSVRLELPGLPPLRLLEVRECPQLCVSPGVAGLLTLSDGIESVLAKGAASCHMCSSEAFGGCAECGKPACLGDPDGYWEHLFYCPEVESCVDCGAHLCTHCSAWAPGFGPGAADYKCPACRPEEWRPRERPDSVPLEPVRRVGLALGVFFILLHLLIHTQETRESVLSSSLPDVGTERRGPETPGESEAHVESSERTARGRETSRVSVLKARAHSLGMSLHHT